MNNNHSNGKIHYEELKQKYAKLQNKHNKLKSRINSILKMSDKNMKSFFNKNVKSDRLNKRFNTIIKQSDKQTKHLLIENEKQSKVINQQSKMALMGEMIENITHQMKQPLSLISTASSSMELKQEMDMLSDEEFKKYTSKILEATSYLDTTINNFKNFFSSNDTKENISITNTIVKSKQLLESKFKGKSIRIIHELNDTFIMVSENDLIQVITNLLSNSIDALENQTSQRLIFITTTANDNQIELEFGDTGGGIDNKIIDKVFNSHFSTKSKNKGSGIGLHMTKMIIEDKLEGNIKVCNKTYQYNNNKFMGACFKITIPK